MSLIKAAGTSEGRELISNMIKSLMQVDGIGINTITFVLLGRDFKPQKGFESMEQGKQGIVSKLAEKIKKPVDEVRSMSDVVRQEGIERRDFRRAGIKAVKTTGAIMKAPELFGTQIASRASTVRSAFKRVEKKKVAKVGSQWAELIRKKIGLLGLVKGGK